MVNELFFTDNEQEQLEPISLDAHLAFYANAIDTLDYSYNKKPQVILT